MSVYVVMWHDYDFGDVRGVFSTREAADAFVASGPKHDDGSQGYEVEAYELDAEVPERREPRRSEAPDRLAPT